MEWLQKIYICILNPFCGISQKINDTTRKRLIYTVVLLLYSTCYIWYSIIGMGYSLTLLSRMIESDFFDYHTYLPGLGETFETSTLESYYHRDLVCIRNTDFCNGFFYRAKHWLLDDVPGDCLGIAMFLYGIW